MRIGTRVKVIADDQWLGQIGTVVNSTGFVRQPGDIYVRLDGRGEFEKLPFEASELQKIV